MFQTSTIQATAILDRAGAATDTEHAAAHAHALRAE